MANAGMRNRPIAPLVLGRRSGRTWRGNFVVIGQPDDDACRLRTLQPRSKLFSIARQLAVYAYDGSGIDDWDVYRRLTSGHRAKFDSYCRDWLRSWLSQR